MIKRIDMKAKPVKYTYQTQLRWVSDRKGILSCNDKPDILVACAPEFGGHPEIWSPEDMFVGMIETCTMATFLWLCDTKKVNIKSYTSEGLGTAQMVGKSMRFNSIIIKIKIGMPAEDDRPEIERILQDISKWCLISNSIKTQVNIEAELFVDNI